MNPEQLLQRKSEDYEILRDQFLELSIAHQKLTSDHLDLYNKMYTRAIGWKPIVIGITALQIATLVAIWWRG